MARPIKVFTLGNHGFISREVGDALGLPSHVRQAQVLAVAATKAAAAQVLAERGHPYQNPRDPEFRQAIGQDVDALADAGLFDEPAVYVTQLLTRTGAPVVVMLPGGAPRRIGHLSRGAGEPYMFVAEAAK